MPEESANYDTILGRMVVDQGLATAHEVHQCLELQRKHKDPADPNECSLAHLLIANGIVTKRQVDRMRPALEAHRVKQQIPGFQVIKRLGSGAMAAVYLAKQLSLDRMVAIKILPQRFTNNAEFVERFYAEGRAAAKLNHPNIVGALDVGRAGDTHFFVMEYVEGRTVYDDMREHKRYKEDEALVVMTQIARAMEHAHNAGIIHRDIKPKNIMITTEGVAKLADMGLARAVSDREAAEAEQGKAFGTPYYISPEQVRGEKHIDLRADLYSFGATFYHALTGRVPFDGPNPSAVMHKHLKSELVPPDHINPKLSAGISEIIEVCMAKNRDQRYDSAGGLLTDLESVARGDPPMIARKKFDFNALRGLSLEAESALPAGKEKSKQPKTRKAWWANLWFWAALLGWAAAAALLATMLTNKTAPPA